MFSVINSTTSQCLIVMPVNGKRFLKSFADASKGLAYLFRSQFNARVELIITCLIIIAGFSFGISPAEWALVLLCVALVLGLEGINTAFEILADKLHPGSDPEIGKAKDVAAGAVFVATILSAVIGLVIFVPYVKDFLMK